MIKGEVYKTPDLNDCDIDEMFNLMTGCYENIKKENFVSDLLKKSGVIILKNPQNEIKGFSTIVFYDLKIDNKKQKILFSGDTVIHRDYWAKNNLASVWLRYAIKKREEFKEPLYWLLISKGYKTYKYLSTFFKTYYPNPDNPTPLNEQKIIDEFAKTFYPDVYDKKAGILKMNKRKDYLKKEYAKIPDEKLNDKAVKFFLEKNPQYHTGNELVCITELSTENVNYVGKKKLLGL